MAVTIKEDCHLKVKLAGWTWEHSKSRNVLRDPCTSIKKGVKWLWLHVLPCGESVWLQAMSLASAPLRLTSERGRDLEEASGPCSRPARSLH